jgi:DNA-binding NarL/FixJ family response regulator
LIDKNRPVLVADDDEYFRLALASLLRTSLGFTEIVEAGSHDQAIELLGGSAEGATLALFDLRMPGVESPANLAAVRECYPTMRVVMVSGSRDKRDILAALDAGLHGFVPKSFGPAELVRALNVVINGDIFVPPFIADLPPSREAVDAAAVPAAVQIPPVNAATRNTPSLSPRQQQVLELLTKGFSNKMISRELQLAEGTVKIHVAALLRHLGVSSRAGAAAAGALLMRPTA